MSDRAGDLAIAIVGMAARLPGARDVDEFWRNLAGGVESITRLSDRDLRAAGVAEARLHDPTYVKAAPILDEPGHFDAGFFGLSPREAERMDPQHRLLLELAHEALESAGHDPDRLAGQVGVFVGAALNTYFLQTGLHRRLADDYIPTLIGNDKDFLATRISYKLNLKGPSITVQTACSTSMVAVHLACQSLQSGETDLALAGAVSVRVPHRAGYHCDGGGVVSPDGHVRAFDARANGTVFGSGGGLLVLKRLTDARAEGDTIRAVIRGSAVNNDGAGKAGYTAPSVDRQAEAVVEALANADVPADSIGYLEAHGSGTPVGDPIEVRALTKAFRRFTQRSGYCALGSVKTNIGHLDAAAAVAGIIKTVLALEHRRVPPSLHFREANPEIDFAGTPFYVNTALREWDGEGPRRAGVMSTGMGGTNAHLVLEEAPALEDAASAPSPHLLLLSAKTETALDEATRRLRGFLAAHESVSLRDVAHTLRVGRSAFAHRRALVCSDREDALAALGGAGSTRVPTRRVDEIRGPTILLMPGLGDHYVGMGHDLYESWPAFRREVDRCAAILEPQLGLDIRTVLYPPGRRWKRRSGAGGIDLRSMLGRPSETAGDGDERTLHRTLLAQPALFTIEYAMTRVWQSLGVEPDAIVGHSMGEYVAACLAGVMSLHDALRLITARARLVDALPRGGMLAVMLSEDELLPRLPDELSISVINGPRLCVVAGPAAAVERFAKRLDEQGVMARPVRNAHAFHSRMLDPIVPALEAEARRIPLHPPTLPYTSNVTGTWVTPAEATDPAYWARHATQPARFHDALRALWRLDRPTLLEAGPGRTLGVLAMQHPDRPQGEQWAPVSSLRHAYENRSDLEQLWQAIGRLWLSGVEFAWDALPPPWRARRIPLPTYPFERRLHWLAPATGDALPAPPAALGKKPDPSSWLYLPSWKRVLPRAASRSAGASGTEGAARWLVFVDDAPCVVDLVAGLESAGHDVVTVRPGGEFQRHGPRSFTLDPTNREQYAALLRALPAPPERVVHGWSVAVGHPAPSDGERFVRAQARGFYSLLFLARALAGDARRDVRLFVLSSHVHEVVGTETLCPERATVLGACLSIGQEYPHLRVTSIDVERPDAPGSAVDLLTGEVLDADASLCVAHRNGRRWVQTYEPVAVPPVGRPSALRTGGVYLITGGLGRIGVSVAEYLAREYRARLVLVGRASLPARATWRGWVEGRAADDPVARRIRAIEEIERLGGEVLYLDANVADEPGMRVVVERARRRFGALHGVIHGAGVVGDYREIADSDPEACEAHFQAKAHGVRALAAALDGEALDFCLLLSSLTSVLGGIGQAAYAASNLYLDAFARRHNRTATVPWLSVNWDVWRLNGEPAATPGRGTTLEELGMSAEEATALLETVLALRTAGQLVVSTGDLGARIDQWVRLDSLRARTPATGAPSTPRPSPSAAADAPQDETAARIARVWEDALGVERVGPHDAFADLGGHSLLAVKVVAELRRAFQVDLPVRALFDAPTVAELARYVENRVIAEIETLSDEEARRLVASP